MKQLLLFLMMFGFAVTLFPQQRMIPSKALRDRAVAKDQPVVVNHDFEKIPGQPAFKDAPMVDEEIIGNTRYDLQSNSSCQNRLYVYDDGTIGATWTFGIADPGFSGRGTGYNYYDGSSWGPQPAQRIESLRTGWPSYAPYGENGELVVSHDFSGGTLLYLTRTEKGTGTWTENILNGPLEVPISWNRSTTSGTDNSVMQVLAITWPTPNGGPVYEGLDGALLYSRSADGGTTWDPENAILDGLTSDDFFGISADDYEWAASQGDRIAFVVGNSWTDFVLMKSNDGGDTWNKTVIWQNPYPLFPYSTPYATDTFYCVDGDHHLAFDNSGKVHVVFGIDRAYSDGSTTYWFPLVDGVGYWNEDMPTFTDDLNALNPYGEAGTELTEDYNLVGWAQDVNNNGTWDILGEVGAYYVGASSMPQIIIDDMDNIYLVFTSVTETFNNGIQDYRHIWARGSWFGTWGDFVDLTGDIAHIFDECVFPSVADKTDDYFYLMYQSDGEPGLAVRGDEDPYGDNNINFMKVLKTDLVPVGVDEHSAILASDDVSQNMPNPFSGISYVNVNLKESCNLRLTVTNMTGQVVYTLPEKHFNHGSYRLEIDAANLAPGVYFYTVNAGGSTVTNKMTVK